MQDPILRDFRNAVTPKFISRIAHTVAFNKRSTAQISGIDFTRMLIMQIGSGLPINYTNLNATITKLNKSVNISNQALSEYFYKESSVELLKSIYEQVFVFQKQTLSENCGKNTEQEIDLFKRILLQDSTICTLQDGLASSYKGSGGSASKASLKIDVIQELKTASVLKVGIFAGNIPDVSLAKLLLSELAAGDLVLRDLGYFKVDELTEISEKKAYFVSRYKPKITVHIGDKSLVDLGKYLNSIYDQLPNQTIDIDVRLGSTSEVRLIAYRMPQEVAALRRKKAKREAACQGYTCSEARLNLCDYIILITNIPRNLVKASTIGTIYRIRWKIELIFKAWKSQWNLQKSLGVRKKTCVLCIVYATLIVCLLTALIHGWLRRIVDTLGREISLDKLSKWLLNRNGCFTLFAGQGKRLEVEIQKDLRKIRMQKRKRKTVIERANSSEAYGEKYAINI